MRLLAALACLSLLVHTGDTRADCDIPCGSLICPTNTVAPAVVEGEVVSVSVAGEAVLRVTAVHGIPEEPIAVDDELDAEIAYPGTVTAGQRVLAVVSSHLVQAFTRVDADGMVRCASVSSYEDFAVAASVLVDAVLDDRCAEALSVAGYEFPSCNDTIVGCAVGSRTPSGGAWSLALLALVAGRLRRRERSDRRS